jgi:gliding motility-associated-like protein
VDEEGDRLDVGTVHVLITDDATGCYTRDSVTIFDECPAIVALPNAFTPNGDGNNDIFRPVRPMDDTTPNDVGESMNIRNYQLRIYNRWGEVIYAEEGSRSEDVVGWDGTYLGQMMPSGTYAWVFVYTDEFSGLEYTMEGNVTLLK